MSTTDTVTESVGTSVYEEAKRLLSQPETTDLTDADLDAFEASIRRLGHIRSWPLPPFLGPQEIQSMEVAAKMNAATLTALGKPTTMTDDMLALCRHSRAAWIRLTILESLFERAPELIGAARSARGAEGSDYKQGIKAAINALEPKLVAALAWLESGQYESEYQARSAVSATEACIDAIQTLLTKPVRIYDV